MSVLTTMASAISIILRPFSAFYDDPTTVEMRMTRPKEVILDRRVRCAFWHHP